MPESPHPVLVTGSNRSGTTWAGRMLCLSNELAYVHEPLNPGIWPRWTTKPIPFRNLYLCEENGGPWEPEIVRVIERRFPFLPQLGQVRSAGDAARLCREMVRQHQGPAHRSTLMKDPIAIFSSEWLAAHFDMRVVMMIRSPLAFAGSIKRLSWAFDFNNWLDQPLLMRDHLADYTDEIRQAVKNPLDLIGQATLTWNVTYDYVARMRERHPEWLFVDYQSLATAPVDEFENLYRALGLRFDGSVRDIIAGYSATTNVKEVAEGDRGDIRRDSRAAIDTWKDRLTTEETDRVVEETRRVASQIYGNRQLP